MDEIEIALNNNKNEGILKHTKQSIQVKKKDIIHELFSVKERKEILQKLKDYRHIDEMNDIRVGCYARWINIENKSLAKGGIIIKVDIGENGIYIVLKNNYNIFTILFDNVFLFQKITNQEHIILSIIDKINKN
jgi:hypothetical protein